MSRYQALRLIGCGPFASSAIAFLNWVSDTPDGVIRFMHIVIYMDEEVEKRDTVPSAILAADGKEGAA